MIWQDIIISWAGVVFILGLSYQVVSNMKDKKSHISLLNSIPTFIWLYAMSYAFYTLELYFSSITTWVTWTLWFILCLQEIYYNKKL